LHPGLKMGKHYVPLKAIYVNRVRYQKSTRTYYHTLAWVSNHSPAWMWSHSLPRSLCTERTSIQGSMFVGRSTVKVNLDLDSIIFITGAAWLDSKSWAVVITRVVSTTCN
jgi:hypothetical protein